jgi:uncharacterized protein
MVKQTLLPLAGVILFIALVGFIYKNPSNSFVSKFISNSAPSTSSLQLKTVTLGSKKVQIEVADTKELHEKGLSDRKSLAEDNGMLFVFNPKHVSPIFWMKNMLFPLDIIWISDGKIIKIDKNIPAPDVNTPDDKISRFAPSQPIDYVLEVNSGFCDKNKIKKGDSVTLPTL